MKGWLKVLPEAGCQRRRLFGLLLIPFLSACEARTMRTQINVSLFNYLDRPIFDVMMNNEQFMSAAAHGFYGANAVLAMQEITLGRQFVSWKLDGPEQMPGNGDLIKAKNVPVVAEIAERIKWLGLHIYPDYTVEIKLSAGTPDELQTERGMTIIRTWEGSQNDS